MAVVEVLLDPWRGGFEIREEGRTVVSVAGTSRGGPKLAGEADLPEGEYDLGLGDLTFGACRASYDLDEHLLKLRIRDLLVCVRIDPAPDKLRIAFEDFK